MNMHEPIKPGDVFGYLTVLEKAPSIPRKNGGVRGAWLTKCKCGNLFTTSTDKLRRERRPGEMKSCGCFKKEKNWYFQIRPRFSYIYKKCPLCKKTKHYSEWGRSKRRLGGLKGLCNKCVYKTKDKSKVILSTTLRKKKVKQSVPKWVDKEELRKIYEKKIELENTLKIRLNVDHLYPLIHDKFCGLTIPSNLQITTEKFNLSKRNTIDSLKFKNLIKGSKVVDGIRFHKSLLDIMQKEEKKN